MYIFSWIQENWDYCYKRNCRFFINRIINLKLALHKNTLTPVCMNWTGLSDRVDFVLREGSMESSYISAVTSHTSYWSNYDVSHFMLNILYPDIQPTSSKPEVIKPWLNILAVIICQSPSGILNMKQNLVNLHDSRHDERYFASRLEVVISFLFIFYFFYFFLHTSVICADEQQYCVWDNIFVNSCNNAWKCRSVQIQSDAIPARAWGMVAWRTIALPRAWGACATEQEFLALLSLIMSFMWIRLQHLCCWTGMMKAFD